MTTSKAKQLDRRPGHADDPVFQNRSKSPDKDKILFMSFFTINTPYEEEAHSLIDSLKSYDLSYYVKGLEDQGSWAVNSFLKPAFIRATMDEFKEYEGFVWLDADSILMREPELFFRIKDVDFAVRGRGPELNLRSILNHCFRIPTRANIRELIELFKNQAQFRRAHNCVLYFKNGPASRRLLNDWIDAIEANGTQWNHDQQAMQYVLVKNNYYKNKLTLFNLPLTYAAKYSPRKNRFLPENTVIRQKQIGRFHK